MAKKNAKPAPKAAKPAAAKPAAGGAKPTKISGASSVRSKSDIFNVIAEHNGLSRKQVAGVFDTMSAIIGADLSKGSGVFKVPGLMKIAVIRKPATKAMEKENPFKKGEMMTVKAKPARNVVKIRPLANLKAMV